VEKGTPGYRARVIEGKVVAALGVAGRDHARRGAGAGREPAAGARSFKDTARVLAPPGAPCAWGGRSATLRAAYDAALRYAKERRQFGEPLASFQIIQQRLVSMLADLTAMQLYCLQIGPPGRSRPP